MGRWPSLCASVRCKANNDFDDKRRQATTSDDDDGNDNGNSNDDNDDNTTTMQLQRPRIVTRYRVGHNQGRTTGTRTTTAATTTTAPTTTTATIRGTRAAPVFSTDSLRLIHLCRAASLCARALVLSGDAQQVSTGAVNRAR